MIFAWLLERCPYCALPVDDESRCMTHGWVEAEGEVIFELGQEDECADGSESA